MLTNYCQGVVSDTRRDTESDRIHSNDSFLFIGVVSDTGSDTEPKYLLPRTPHLSTRQSLRQDTIDPETQVKLLGLIH